MKKNETVRRNSMVKILPTLDHRPASRGLLQSTAEELSCKVTYLQQIRRSRGVISTAATSQAVESGVFYFGGNEPVRKDILVITCGVRYLSPRHSSEIGITIGCVIW